MSIHNFLVSAIVDEDGAVTFRVDPDYEGWAIDSVIIGNDHKPVSDPNSNLWAVDARVEKALSVHLSRYINLAIIKESK